MFCKNLGEFLAALWVFEKSLVVDTQASHRIERVIFWILLHIHRQGSKPLVLIEHLRQRLSALLVSFECISIIVHSRITSFLVLEINVGMALLESVGESLTVRAILYWGSLFRSLFG